MHKMQIYEINAEKLQKCGKYKCGSRPKGTSSPVKCGKKEKGEREAHGKSPLYFSYIRELYVYYFITKPFLTDNQS